MLLREEQRKTLTRSTFLVELRFVRVSSMGCWVYAFAGLVSEKSGMDVFHNRSSIVGGKGTTYGAIAYGYAWVGH